MSRQHDPFSEDTPKPEERSARDAQRESADWAWLMSSPQGRRVAWRLLALTGLHRGSFSGDPLHTAFAEGRRAVGLQLEAAILKSFPQYLLMLQEANAT